MLAAAMDGPCVLLLQEARAAAAARPAITRGSWAADAAMLWVPEADGLVAAAVRGVAARQMPPVVPAPLRPRIQHLAVFRPGLAPVHLTHLCAPASNFPGAAAACSHLVAAALGAAAGLGQVPCFLAGDFNQDPLPAAAAATLALSG